MPGPSIQVPADCAKAMARHLEAAWPNEGCGILIGRANSGSWVLQRIVEATNMNQERGRDRFEIDPLTYMRTERELASGEQVIGFFHSHPDCPNVPSETDRQFAQGWPDFVWIIQRVDGADTGAKTTSLRAFLLDAGGERFDEIGVLGG